MQLLIVNCVFSVKTTIMGRAAISKIITKSTTALHCACFEIMHLSMFGPRMGGGGGRAGNPRAFDLVKLHSGRDFGIHNGSVGGKFDFGRHLGSGEGLRMSDPPSWKIPEVILMSPRALLRSANNG